MHEKEKNFISAICYVRNNEKEITPFLEMITAFLQNTFEKYEILCVDDASTDGSVEAIRTFASKQEHITLTLLKLGFFHGTELAMNAGNELAIGDFVFEFDTCFYDYDTAVLDSVYRKALDGNDIVLAVPNQKGTMKSRFFYALFKHYSTTKVEMAADRFHLLSRRAINRIHMMKDRILYRKVVYSSCGLQTESVSYPGKRFEDHSRGMREYRFNLALDSLILFTQAGYKISVRMTLGMVLFAIACAIYAAVMYVSGVAITGWTTTMLFLSFSFGILFGILTIIVKYLSILVDLVFRKKNYIYENIEKLSKE